MAGDLAHFIDDGHEAWRDTAIANIRTGRRDLSTCNTKKLRGNTNPLFADSGSKIICCLDRGRKCHVIESTAVRSASMS